MVSSSLLLPLFLLLPFHSVSLASSAQDGTNDKKNDKHKPNNILLLLTDDQDVELGSFDTQTHMPKLHNLLREEGVTFAKGAFVHVPICCPSRSSLLTGKYLHHGGLAKNNSVSGNCYGEAWRESTEPHQTIAVHAKAAGYTTVYAGKYLNQYRYDGGDSQDASLSIPAGWDYWYGLEGNSRYYNYNIVERTPPEGVGGVSNTSNNVRLHKHGDTYPEDYLPLVLQAYTLETLPKLPEPWLMVVAWPSPHGPFTPEPKNAHLYPNVTAPRTSTSPNYNASQASQNSKHWLLRQLGAITETTAQKIDDIYRNRLRTLATVDDHVGALVDHLAGRIDDHSDSDTTSDKIEAVDESSSLSSNGVEKSSSSSLSSMLDRTVIIYTSDNGFQFGQHRLAIDKRHLYEHDIRVPFVVRGPFGSGGKNVTVPKERIISTVDIAPTMLEIFLEGMAVTNQNGDSGGGNTAGAGASSMVDMDAGADADTSAAPIVDRLRTAIGEMDGRSFWRFLRTIGREQQQVRQSNQHQQQQRKQQYTPIVHGNAVGDDDDDGNEKEYNSIYTDINTNADTDNNNDHGNSNNNNNSHHDGDEYDPFLQRTDLLISYHGEGDPSCGLSECPAPFNKLWWMPDSYNNTYHCVRTMTMPMTTRRTRTATVKSATTTTSNMGGEGEVNEWKKYQNENSIYCVFYDDEDFVEYYDLNKNPFQLGNDYHTLSDVQVQRYEKRLEELLS